MKKMILSALALLLPAFVLSLSAQTAEEEDLDPKYAVDMLAPGTAAPDFTLGDINGKQVKLSDFRGKTVVLAFWASWCPDCRAEIPSLKQLYSGADPDKVEFVFLSYDRDKEVWRKYVADNAIPGVQLFDPAGKKDSAIGADYHTKWIPSLYVIDPDGKVVLGTVMVGKLSAHIPSVTLQKPASRQLCGDEGCE